ncbi:hypothetical protein [Wolinella succinogenes]|uniref:Lipoprotein n=1 Tax=Wolinella succinogenes (strain ATCC 29543 / DSM 1740 / CCUG 13145 / JCM 31913 / LMG 7466 / NCTC 11488 / FDC 602W) TaxID=273121 RepID=Q7MR58_WOLSU|nr:hypothetical protein [Wolinella succinogenes]NLU34718.1 hypothetical protein [Wolinella succinogenes]CAE10685.1 hypothetical protein WS1654 [Wolinella succinogenes]VEG80832.1 Uncharacterised protein [Wolinella succinogenes]HCZ18641.1 hypothetical protein [Helicobacter sp.]
MKNLILVASFASLWLLGGCANKVEHAYVDLYKTCYQKEYQLSIGDIRSDGTNELDISSNDVRDALLQALRDSNCFELSSSGSGYGAGYSTDLLYTSRIIKEKFDKNIVTSEEKTFLIVETVITMQNFNETKTYRGKSQFEMKNTKILGIGNETQVNYSDKIRSIQTAVRSAVKEAAEDLRTSRRTAPRGTGF